MAVWSESHANPEPFHVGEVCEYRVFGAARGRGVLVFHQEHISYGYVHSLFMYFACRVIIVENYLTQTCALIRNSTAAPTSKPLQPYTTSCLYYTQAIMTSKLHAIISWRSRPSSGSIRSAPRMPSIWPPSPTEGTTFRSGRCRC